ncbi:ATP-dependent helicase HrpB [Actinoplanes sp. ATCC 53533]|uniref:ATP-dependent helicase HrpB n=1 Tax=Actinoplanes sp. ATCC 53533 TaxID=1288362 RepID=UPI000F773A2E|nr:ATP-dependent helicase HrpB [Actinoplanes sp. ATCC 53533]RSM60372.1 ATP-dependent helicase HrpB [Actinoplanes sp. ATCC 53533]
MLIAAEDLPDLPIRAVLAEVAGALAAAGAAVLVAPPGTGKTTLVPLALAGAAPGAKVVVAEPRRVAARAAARRMASLLGEQVGDRVGYTVRGDRQVSGRTRVEVVTTGVLVRRLHRDPELAGTAVVILDECHERHLDSDLALAFLIEVRAALRPDLRVLATSATAESRRLAEVLGGAPVVEARSALHPVAVHWSPPPQPITPPHGLRVDPKLLDHVATTIRRALAEGDGDVLAFLPGAREIETVANRLRGADAEIVALHGRLSGSAQDAALRPSPVRRVVLATAVAESSLTVPGVRAVVDAGLSRVPRMDHGRGLGALVTVPVSRASATQRAGRAGRGAPGRVYRCWSQAQHDRLPAQPEPEIAAADLTGFALDLAQWGHPDGTGLSLPDPPPPGALQVATDTLRALGATDAAGRITARGRALADAGLHPRLARALLDGARTIGGRRAAEVVALLDADRTADDLAAAWRRARTDRDPAWRTEVRRLTAATTRNPATDEDATDAAEYAITEPSPRTAGSGGGRRKDLAEGGREWLADDLAAGLIVGLAYPERVARVREPGGRAYLMAGGTAADLTGGSGLAGTTWLAIADADRAPGARTARIRSAAPLDEATAREAAAALLESGTEIAWRDGDVVARRTERLGAITLVERRIDKPDPERVRAALLDGLRREGLALLTWSRTTTELRERLAFAHAALGAPWPAVDDGSLLKSLEDWLPLGQARRRADLAKIDTAGALRRLLPWSVAGRLDEIAPERLPVPSGSKVRIDYADPAAPVLAVKVQEAFGWREAPRLADGRIPILLHLLSPAGRPVAVTRDLASFWATGYPQVRAELRGRYPRHPWPEDPTTAVPTRRLNRRSP